MKWWSLREVELEMGITPTTTTTTVNAPAKLQREIGGNMRRQRLSENGTHGRE